jgi:hypothetical protein
MSDDEAYDGAGGDGVDDYETVADEFNDGDDDDDGGGGGGDGGDRENDDVDNDDGDDDGADGKRKKVVNNEDADPREFVEAPPSPAKSSYVEKPPRGGRKRGGAAAAAGEGGAVVPKPRKPRAPKVAADGTKKPPARRAPAKPATASVKLEKLLAKERAAAAREALKVLEMSRDLNSDTNLTEAREEAQMYREQCRVSLKRLGELTKAGNAAATSMRDYVRLAARIKKATAKPDDKEEATLLQDCSVAITTLASEVAALRDQMSQLVTGFSDNIDKCDATARFSVQRVTGSLAAQEPPQQQLALTNGNAAAADPTTVAKIGTSSAQGSGLRIAVGPTGEGSFSLSTRKGPQSINGMPGATYVNMSLAREHGGVQKHSQTEDQRRVTMQKRARIERREHEQFRALVNPSTSLRTLAAEEISVATNAKRSRIETAQGVQLTISK